MKAFATAAIAAVGLVMGAAAAAAIPAPADTLWSRAVRIASASGDWRPGRTVVRTEHLTKDGRVRSVEEVTLAHGTGVQGDEASPVLVRFMRDGVDVTEEERAKRASGREGGGARRGGGEGRRGSLTVGGTPFHPQSQASVSFRRTSERRSIAGRDCQGFDYSRTDENGKQLVGTAFLDTRTGAPLLLRERPDPLPRFAERVWVTTRFRYEGPDEWYPTRIEVDASGGFLFVKKSVRTTIDLLDYRRVGSGHAEGQ
jgi:hypothetical protein